MKTVPIAKALILDSENNMLILRRSQSHPTLAGHLDLPGGLIEPGEEPGEALSREIKEETGLQISSNNLTLAYAGTEIYEDEARIRFFYLAKLESKTPQVSISWEHDNADWQAINKLETIENEFRSFYHDALRHVRVNQLLVI